MIDQYSNKKPRLFLVAAIGILLLPAAAYADDSLGAALEICATIENDNDRLSCYDALALLNDGVAPAVESAAEPAAAEPAPAEPVAEPAAEPAPTAPETLTPAAKPAPAAVAATAETLPEVIPLSDEIGKSGVRKDDDAPQKHSARVTKCVENKQSGQYYFYFDNGQVWKQSNYRKLLWRKCEFDVTIAKAIFGYDMYIPEKDRTVRVSRLR